MAPSLILEKASDKGKTRSAIYQRTKDIRLTQRLARYKSILTTAMYSHPTDDDLLRAVTGLPC